MPVTGKNKLFLQFYGSKGKRYSGLNPLVKDSPGEAGFVVFDDWMLDAASGVTGIGSSFDSADISAAVGTVSGGAGVTGLAAVLDLPDTASATGAISVTGLGSATDRPDLSAATGAVGLSAVGQAIDTADTASALASISATGSGGAIDRPDQASATGAVSTTATGAAIDAPDLANAAGTVSGGGVVGTGGAIDGDDIASILGLVSGGNSEANTLGGIAPIGNYYYRQRHEPLRPKKSEKARARQEEADKNEPVAQKLPKPFDKAAAQAVKEAKKRLFDAESAVRQAENELSEANLRLIAYLEAAEMEIQAEDDAIMRIIAEML